MDIVGYREEDVLAENIAGEHLDRAYHADILRKRSLIGTSFDKQQKT